MDQLEGQLNILGEEQRDTEGKLIDCSKQLRSFLRRFEKSLESEVDEKMFQVSYRLKMPGE